LKRKLEDGIDDNEINDIDEVVDMEFINITQDTIDVSAHLHATYTEYNQLLKNYNALESSRSFSKPSQIPDILSQMRTIFIP